MNAPTLFFHTSPFNYLASGRAFACGSALGYVEPDEKTFRTLARFLAAPTFYPKHATIDFGKDCAPYRIITTPDKLSYVYMDSWARAGIRYLKPDFDLNVLAPQSFYMNWWSLYRTAFSDIPEGSPMDETVFVPMYASIAVYEEAILTLLDKPGRLLLDPAKIKRLLKTGESS